jgi:hypothetical protein
MKFDPMVLALIFIIALVAVSFWRLHKNPNVDFNLLDLLMENGRVSKVSCMVLGSFAMNTWIMVQLTLHDKLTEVYFSAYIAAWVAPLIVRMIAQQPQQKEEKP